MCWDCWCHTKLILTHILPLFSVGCQYFSGDSVYDVVPPEVPEESSALYREMIRIAEEGPRDPTDKDQLLYEKMTRGIWSDRISRVERQVVTGLCSICMKCTEIYPRHRSPVVWTQLETIECALCSVVFCGGQKRLASLIEYFSLVVCRLYIDFITTT